MAKARSQAERRRSFNNLDQFGRKWLVTIEVDTGHPTGSITPCFTDEMATPQKYMSVPDSSPRSIVIDVDHWARDLKQTLGEYRRHFDEVGMQLYGDNYDAEKAWTSPRPSHRDIVGKPPLDWRMVQKYHDNMLSHADRPDKATAVA